ncbi:T9SS type A sorting domain-containing protein [Paraflavisolibacter sp. H34]|uniref:T9SS type A sorting domain-containing protein n=1 Tax=Huijunlia imazamoxiresistens TaxID=3127457 RepID=UPI00301A3D19
MKNFLCTLFLLCSFVSSMAQLRINEIYSKPVNGDVNKEFFELALDPNAPASENSDGYVFMTYFEDATEKGVYVIDMPFRDIAPGTFIFGAAGPRFSKYQDSKTFTSTPVNWNGTISSGWAKKFTFNGTSWSAGLDMKNKNINNVFSKSLPDLGYSDMVALLFKKESGGMELIDGFIASEAEDRFEVPAYIQALPPLTIPLVRFEMPNENVTINFGSLGSAELWAVAAADFAGDEGYYFCGSWDQPGSGQFLTPNFTNTSLQGNPLQAITNCFPESNKVTFTEVSGQVSAYPVTASLYEDRDMNMQLSEGDVKYSQIVMKRQGQTYSMNKPVGNNFILVLDGSGQCFDDVIPFFCDPAIVTPVTFISFNGLRKGANVELNWQTGSESNNKGFYVERKNGSGEWDRLAFVSSKATGGSSSSTLSYSFNDANNASGVTQYRLLQVDYDGKSAHSSIVSVRGQSQQGSTVVYPNPSSNGSVNVVFDQAVTLRNVIITDMVGRVIQQWKNFGSSSLQINNLKSGMYNIMIQNIQSGTHTVERVSVNR